MPKLSEAIQCKCGCEQMFVRTHAVQKYAEPCRKRLGLDKKARTKSTGRTAKYRKKKKEQALQLQIVEPAVSLESATVETKREQRARRAAKLKAAYESIIMGQAQLDILRIEEMIDEQYVLAGKVGLEQVSQLLSPDAQDEKARPQEALLFPELLG